MGLIVTFSKFYNAAMLKVIFGRDVYQNNCADRSAFTKI